MFLSLSKNAVLNIKVCNNKIIHKNREMKLPSLVRMPNLQLKIFINMHGTVTLRNQPVTGRGTKVH